MRSGRLLAMALTLIAPALMAWAPDAYAQDLSRYQEFRLATDARSSAQPGDGHARTAGEGAARGGNIGTFRP